MNEPHTHETDSWEPPKWDLVLLEYLQQRHRMTADERHYLLCSIHELLSPMPCDHEDDEPLPPPERAIRGGER